MLGGRREWGAIVQWLQGFCWDDEKVLGIDDGGHDTVAVFNGLNYALSKWSK